MRTVARAIHTALTATDPYAKVKATRAAARDWRLGRLAFAFDVAMPDAPGRPERPELLPPGRMPKRGRAQSLRGRIALLHALAHIEFTAIDLALDMGGRFGADMPPEFTGDFVATAADEAMHFVLLDRRLRALGSFYGDLPAHGGLWEAAHITRQDIAARLAVVPLVLEARGLDVTPAMIDRLSTAGDDASARILTRILADEIRHVHFGVKHFTAVCERRAEVPELLWKSLVEQHFGRAVAGPFNSSARESAGLPRAFYDPIAL